jgi:hypothetical protein
LALLARFRAPLATALIVSLAACGGGGGGGTPPVSSTPTPTPAPSSNAYTCPSSDTQLAVSRGGSSSIASETRRGLNKGGAMPSTSLLAISYRTSAIANPATTLDARVASLGATKFTEFDYPKTGLATRMLHVTPSSMTQAESTLRSTAGVVSVSPSRRLSTLTVNGPYLGNDPYFVGASGTTAPLYQTASTGGQWDMHIVQLEHAFDYSQPSNGSSVPQTPSALGSTNVKLAIIDTGEDVTHPELAKASIVRTECFITNEAETAQSTGTFVTDGDGHGTDVTGIAVANPLNDYGFVGDGGNVSLMLYRVFPTPDDNCTPGNAAALNDPQCGTQDTDIASAIDDAVANGANVISMSLGGSISITNNNGCTSPGVDADPVEGNAVENAIAHNVIIVAASGNSGGQGVDAPACDAGVIAAGASGYEDGQANGTNSGSSVGSEYVTGYTQYGTGQWGIVAPGGDPSTAEESPSAPIDYLHWIENIWTTTPFDSNFAGSCSASFGDTGNCRTLIVGTSMATPHIAGAAALILSVSSAYQSPSAMFNLLCTTADPIGDPHQGCGRLNVYRAMATALHDPTPP